MKPQMVKNLLMSQIKTVAANAKSFCIDAERNFSRKRKLTMEKVISGIIGMGSGSLTNELLDLFNDSPETPTSSAFCQQRCKITVEAFEAVFRLFSKKLCDSFEDELPVLAVDGSKIQIPTNPDDVDSFLPGSNGQKPYNLLHLNALYNLNHQIYQDAIIQKVKSANEHFALIEMVDRSLLRSALLMADRGYESYNNLAHVQEKGWYFLFRIKDGDYGIKQGLSLPNEEFYDVSFELNLTRKQTNEVKELIKDRNHYRWIPSDMVFDYLPPKSRKKDPVRFYKLSFRIVRFPISNDTYETIITNLPTDKYPAEEIKRLYSLRWGIETSFRFFKLTLGAEFFHARKRERIVQEIWSRMILYNFCMEIANHAETERKAKAQQTNCKYVYTLNISESIKACHDYLLLSKSIQRKTDLVGWILKAGYCPIRKGRNFKRKHSSRGARSFNYR